MEPPFHSLSSVVYLVFAVDWISSQIFLQQVTSLCYAIARSTLWLRDSEVKAMPDTDRDTLLAILPIRSSTSLRIPSNYPTLLIVMTTRRRSDKAMWWCAAACCVVDTFAFVVIGGTFLVVGGWTFQCLDLMNELYLTRCTDVRCIIEMEDRVISVPTHVRTEV